MQIIDKVTLGDGRVTADGYLVIDARIARTGIQEYLGRELGRPEMNIVRVYRSEEEVFAADAMASFAYRPVTDDHPEEPVSAKNWKRYAAGMTGDQVARDGGFIRVPMTLMDQAAIDAVRGGKRELSCGYTCDLKFEPGTTPDGQAYDAVQTNIRGNHLAIVSAGRAGSECRVGDEADEERNMQKMLVDGIMIELSDTAAQVVAKVIKQNEDAVAAMSKATADHIAAVAAKDKDLATKDAEIDKLTKSQVTGAALDKLVADRADVSAKAKALVKDFDVSNKSLEDIRRGVVIAKLGDAAIKDKSDAYIEARFDALCQDVKMDVVTDPVRGVISTGLASNDAVATADKAHQGMTEYYRDAWKPSQQKGAA